MLDRFTGLKVFIQLAQSGSLSGAARTLGMSQTMATKHLAAIEDRLGVRLVERTTRRMTLTEAGRAYLASAERIVADLDETEASIGAARAQARGLLRVNAPVSFGIKEIAPLLPDFLAAYPQVSVDLGLNDRVVDLVEEGWDMAVRIGRLAESSLIARRLAPSRMVVCGAPAYLAQRGRPRTLADLAGHECLGYTIPTPASAERWRFGLRGEIALPVSARLRASNGDALREAAVGGAGLCYLPTFIVSEDVKAGRLDIVTLDTPCAEFDGIFAITPSRRAPAKTRALIDFLIQSWRPAPHWDRDLSGERD